ncbi:unnamed protein product [Vitrella brassicaformis CCMP3155]|uniref:Peptidase S74 domain-containing protein n=1 Tax=Vitrella brassicaformis (strain CCMP3155) TaxID=1169540 RepID=A0A0G4ESV5_VITBC|nr:unnamed protein product [Vitrella brassicaformis CCMP3155]|eukprot:CEM00796.1 unnamed protein product [Vitrella brassicaformis CCMP3155]
MVSVVALRLSLLVAVCLAVYTLPGAHAECEPDIVGNCTRLVAGDPQSRRVLDGEVVAAADVRTDQNVRAFLDVEAEGDVRAFRDVVAIRNMSTRGEVKANSITVGRRDPNVGDTGGDGNIVAAGSLTVSGRSISAIGANTFVRQLRTAGATFGGIGDVNAGDDVFVGDSLFVRGRAISRAFELSDTDNQPPSSFAEWGGRNRSSAYEAFRQLPVHSDPHNRLTLAAQDVSRLFPSAVETFEDDDQPEEGGKGRPTKHTTIDLTQLIFTQMSVIQDLQARIARLENGAGRQPTHPGRGGKKGKGAGGPPSVVDGKGGSK